MYQTRNGIQQNNHSEDLNTCEYACISTKPINAMIPRKMQLNAITGKDISPINMLYDEGNTMKDAIKTFFISSLCRKN